MEKYSVLFGQSAARVRAKMMIISITFREAGVYAMLNKIKTQHVFFLLFLKKMDGKYFVIIWLFISFRL